MERISRDKYECCRYCVGVLCNDWVKKDPYTKTKIADFTPCKTCGWNPEVWKQRLKFLKEGKTIYGKSRTA